MIFTGVETFSSIVSSALKGFSLHKWRRDFLLEIFMSYLYSETMPSCAINLRANIPVKEDQADR